jgi:signal transduction histidine kinase
MITQAEKFFAEAIMPMEEMHRAAMEADVSLKQQIAALRQRTGELAAANLRLKKEVVQRKAAEKALKKSEAHHKLLLERSRTMQEQLRHLSRHILLTQEEERKEISRELHDEIAQTLAGINVHLASLKVEASAQGLSKKIASTQKLVERSVKIVHRFALELRPTVLDDLGIIPALHSYMKDFTKRTGIHIQFTAFAGMEQLNSTQRTVLFRVAQAALANVAQHAHATRIKVTIKKLSGAICMEINDNGKSFEVERVLFAKRNKRLGLIGMRERVEMVGGSFGIESAPGKGTTVQARLPFNLRIKNQASS